MKTTKIMNFTVRCLAIFYCLLFCGLNVKAQSYITLPDLLSSRFDPVFMSCTPEECEIRDCNIDEACTDAIVSQQLQQITDRQETIVENISEVRSVRCRVGDATVYEDRNFLDITKLQLPAELIIIRICDGSEHYLFASEFSNFPAPVEVIQRISITSFEQTFNIVNNGQIETVNLSGFLDMIFYSETLSDEEVITDDYKACGEVVCTTPEVSCTNEEQAAQEDILELLELQNEHIIAQLLGYPLDVFQVALCGGKSLWVLESEKQLLLGQAVPFVEIQSLTISENNTQIDLPYPCNGDSYDDNITVITIDPTCDDTLSGEIFIELTGDAIDVLVQFSIDGGLTFQSSPIFQDLEEGGYTVVVADADLSVFTRIDAAVKLQNPCKENDQISCSDGIDNDDDGLIDCSDIDCCAYCPNSMNDMVAEVVAYNDYLGGVIHVFSNSGISGFKLTVEHIDTFIVLDDNVLLGPLIDGTYNIEVRDLISSIILLDTIIVILENTESVKNIIVESVNECKDGVDNDSDGLVDDDDDDCRIINYQQTQFPTDMCELRNRVLKLNQKSEFINKTLIEYGRPMWEKSLSSDSSGIIVPLARFYEQKVSALLIIGLQKGPWPYLELISRKNLKRAIANQGECSVLLNGVSNYDAVGLFLRLDKHSFRTNDPVLSDYYANNESGDSTGITVTTETEQGCVILCYERCINDDDIDVIIEREIDNCRQMPWIPDSLCVLTIERQNLFKYEDCIEYVEVCIVIGCSRPGNLPIIGDLPIQGEIETLASDEFLVRIASCTDPNAPVDPNGDPIREEVFCSAIEDIFRCLPESYFQQNRNTLWLEFAANIQSNCPQDTLGGQIPKIAEYFKNFIAANNGTVPSLEAMIEYIEYASVSLPEFTMPFDKYMAVRDYIMDNEIYKPKRSPYDPDIFYSVAEYMALTETKECSKCKYVNVVDCIINKAEEICDSGFDDNGDGLVDCDDPTCGSDSVLVLQVSVDQHAMCDDSTGQISVIVNGGDILDMDICFGDRCIDQETGVINALPAGDYDISVKTLGGCNIEFSISSEICDNGIDDDGDGYIDCDDVDCLLNRDTLGNKSPSFEKSSGLCVEVSDELSSEIMSLMNNNNLTSSNYPNMTENQILTRALSTCGTDCSIEEFYRALAFDDIIIEDESLTNCPLVKCVYDRLFEQETNLFKETIKELYDDPQIITKIKIGEDDGSGATSYDPSTGVITIQLSSNLDCDDSDISDIQNDLDIAATILHEAYHAEMMRELINAGYDPNSLGTYQELWDNYYVDWYAENYNSVNNLQHAIMVYTDNFIEMLARALHELNGDDNLTWQHFQRIAWEGLDYVSAEYNSLRDYQEGGAIWQLHLELLQVNPHLTLGCDN